MADGDTNYFENNAEFYMHLVDPAAKKDFEHLNKDLVTTVLNNAEIQEYRLASLIIGKLEPLGVENAKRDMYLDIATLVAVTKTRGKGFLNKILVKTVNQNQRLETTESHNK